MPEENVFFKFVKEGKIEFTEDGKIIAFNEHIIQLPVRVLNKLLVLLKENFGEDKAKEILKELGRFQIRQAIKRYIKIMGWREVPKERVLEFAKLVAISLGWGKYIIEKIGENYRLSITKTPFAEEFLLEYGKMPFHCDWYISGAIEMFFTIISNKSMVCEEVKCYAKGDDCCEFIVKPKEETEEKETK